MFLSCFDMIFFPLSSSGSYSYNSWCYRSHLCVTISCLLKFGCNCCLANVGSHCCLWDSAQGVFRNLLCFVHSLLLSTKNIMVIPAVSIWHHNSDLLDWFLVDLLARLLLMLLLGLGESSCLLLYRKTRSTKPRFVY